MVLVQGILAKAKDLKETTLPYAKLLGSMYINSWLPQAPDFMKRGNSMLAEVSRDIDDDPIFGMGLNVGNIALNMLPTYYFVRDGIQTYGELGAVVGLSIPYISLTGRASIETGKAIGRKLSGNKA